MTPGLSRIADDRAVFEFAPFVLDASQHRLWRDGREIALTPKTFEILRLLVTSGGRTIPKEEFMRTVWPDTVVEEGNLADNISILRQLLGDDAREPRFIKTVPRRGYRFVADVRRDAQADAEVIVHERTRTRIVVDEETTAAPRRPWAIAAATVGALAVAVAAIVFTRTQPRTRLTASVGVPASPVVTPLTTYADHEFSPALSPDGKMVAFARRDGNREQINIYVKQVDIDVDSPLRLTSTIGREGNPAWSPDGRYIAFTRGAVRAGASGIFLIPALGGTERRLVQSETVGAMAFSPDGKTLAYASKPAPDEPYAISLLDVTTLEARPLTHPPPDAHGDYWVAFSPDGKQVAFARTEHQSGGGDLYVVDAAGGQPRRVTFDDRAISGIAWDPGRDLLIFSSDRMDRRILWKVPASGGTPQPLDPTVEDAYEPSVDRAGEHLAYSKQSSDSNVYRLDLSRPDAQPTALLASTRHELYPRVSPDGQRIVFEADRSGDDELWLADVDGSNVIQLTRTGKAGAAAPAWSPDGKQIAYVSRTDNVSDIFVVGADGGRPRQVTSHSNADAPAWSRDGRYLYFSTSRGQHWQVFKVPVAGGTPVQVTRDGGYESRESVDGRFLFYNKGGYGTIGIYRQPVGGGAEELLVPSAIQLSSLGDWSVTSDGIYFVHRYDLVEGRLHVAKQQGIRFFDFATRATRFVAPLPDPGGSPGLTVLDGGKAAIYSRSTMVLDLMLIRNYR